MRKLTKYEQVPNSTTTMEVDYYFDALGRRVAKKIKTRSNEFTNSFTYLANQDKILLAKSGDDKVQLQVDGQGIDEHWAQINKSGIKTFISDHLGTVINSEVTNDLKITGAFGEVLQATPEMEATTNPLIYGYTGRQFEPETGLYFYRNRVYDQNSGRFMTKDPMGVSAGDVNLYRYVKNTPYLAIDPLGLITVFADFEAFLSLGESGSSESRGVALSISFEKGVEYTTFKTEGTQTGGLGAGASAGINVGLVSGTQSDFLGDSKERFSSAGFGTVGAAFSTIETSSGESGFSVSVPFGAGASFTVGDREVKTTCP